MLKQEYKEEEMALKDALKLAVKVLDKTLDITKLTPDKGGFTLSSKVRFAMIVFLSQYERFYFCYPSCFCLNNHQETISFIRLMEVLLLVCIRFSIKRKGACFS